MLKDIDTDKYLYFKNCSKRKKYIPNIIRISITIVGIILMSLYIWHNVTQKKENGEEVDFFIIAILFMTGFSFITKLSKMASKALTPPIIKPINQIHYMTTRNSQILARQAELLTDVPSMKCFDKEYNDEFCNYNYLGIHKPPGIKINKKKM